MEKNLPYFLTKDVIERLEKNNEIIYFNYSYKLPKRNEKGILRILKKNSLSKETSHILIGNNLYVKEYGRYRLLKEDWISSEKGQQYKPFLDKIASQK